jgi:hypothetical protein
MMSSTEKEGTLRRSGRKRVSTTVKIQGYDVKRQNNYTVNASTYEMNTDELDTAQNKKPRTTAANKSAPRNSQPRKQSESEKARLKHNDAIKAAIEAKKSFQMDWLAKHKGVLDPFVDESVRQKLTEWSNRKKASAPSYQKEELYVQPDLVTGGEMRDYQLAGLNFLLDLHRQNIGMILGDEMGKYSFPLVPSCPAYSPLSSAHKLNHIYFPLRRPRQNPSNNFFAGLPERQR